MKIYSVVSVDANFVVLKFDEKSSSKEVLIPMQQIRRIERGSSILDDL